MTELEVTEFLATASASIVKTLACQAIRSHRTNERTQLRAWEVTLGVLRAALSGWSIAASWRLVLEFPMRRLGRRIDAVLVTERAVLVRKFKVGQSGVLAADRLQVEDYALDLQDFHAASRGHVIVPILVATEAATLPNEFSPPLNFVTGVLAAGANRLGNLLRDLWTRLVAA